MTPLEESLSALHAEPPLTSRLHGTSFAQEFDVQLCFGQLQPGQGVPAYGSKERETLLRTVVTQILDGLGGQEAAFGKDGPLSGFGVPTDLGGPQGVLTLHFKDTDLGHTHRSSFLLQSVVNLDWEGQILAIPLGHIIRPMTLSKTTRLLIHHPHLSDYSRQGLCHTCLLYTSDAADE